MKNTKNNRKDVFPEIEIIRLSQKEKLMHNKRKNPLSELSFIDFSNLKKGQHSSQECSQIINIANSYHADSEDKLN